MSFLADVITFWSNNVILNAALPVASAPSGKVWTGVVADSVALPFAVLTEVVSTFNPTVGQWYYDQTTLQISIFSNTLANALALSDTVAGQFDRAIIASTYMVALRQDRKTVADPGGAYHVVLEYLINKNGQTVN